MKRDALGRRVNPASHIHLRRHGGWSECRSTYQCWQDMKQRCYNQKSRQYKNYGARGIRVCKEWVEDFSAFLRDMGKKPDGLTLDRIDNDGPYSPENCRWATRAMQRTNQRTCVFLEYNGQRMTATEWAKRTGLHRTTIVSRLRSGWPIEKILEPSERPGLRRSSRDGRDKA